MKRHIAKLMVVAAMLSAVLLPASTVLAADPPIGFGCDVDSSSPVCKQSGNAKAKVNDYVKNIVNLLIFVIGIISVIMIVIGGIRYTTSGGDSSQVSGAKNTIIYAIVGLIIAIMAFAIVNFVLGFF